MTVRRSCDDCKACVTESYVVQGDSGQKVRCAHPSLAKPKYIGDTSWETPQWCPALVDADAADSRQSVPSDHSAAAAGREVTEEMVERAALALYEANTAMVWDDASGTVRFHWKEDARAALTAALARDGGDADA